jgi:hypothetical protein
MANIKTPIRTVFDANGEAIGLSEFQFDEAVGYLNGGTGLTSLGSSGQTLAVNANRDGLEWVTGQDLQNSDELPEGSTNLYFTIPRVRSSISVNGDLTYNSSTGEISVTTYKDTDVESYLSGGTGVSFSNGVISIGQPVNSTDNVTFNDVTVDGTLNSDDITASQITVTGNLVVQGNTTTINSTEISVSDKTLLLADGSANSSIADGSGLIIDGANAQLTYQSSDDNWLFNKDLKVGGAIVASGAAGTFSDDGIYLQNKGSSIFDIGAWRDGASVAILTFSTDGGNDTEPVERMRVDSSGLEVNGSVSATNINSTSDQNLKKDIVKIDNALDKVQSINGYLFTYKDTDQRSAGVIAQEVEKVLPEVINGEEGHKTISYGNMVGLLIEAMKEQNETINVLKNRIMLLENSINNNNSQ